MKFGVGQPVRRFEDQSLITGQGRYTDDILLDNPAHAYVLRAQAAQHLVPGLSQALRIRALDGLHRALDIARKPQHRQGTGLGLRDGELAAAKSRFHDDRVTFHQAKAQAIPLPDASVDYVLCHMAFMLMDSIEEVISEIKRVLKPGGKFSVAAQLKRTTSAQLKRTRLCE